MSNLRWILLFAGFAILLLLYFSGRPRRSAAYQGQGGDGHGRRDPDDLDNSLERNHTGIRPAGVTEMPYAGSHDSAYQHDPLLEAEGLGQNATGYLPHPAAGQADPAYLEAAHGFSDMDPADMARPGGGYAGQAMHPEDARVTGYDNQYTNAQHADSLDPRMPYAEDPAYEVPSAAPVDNDYGDPTVALAPVAPTPTPAPTTLGGKLDAFSARFTSRRKKTAAASKDSGGEESDNPMVILLHVAAPDGQMIDGQLLLQVFEQRRYHFGEKNIFHSLHQGKTVFSIAKMVEPGYFDVNDISSFETPGLLLILQLPGPVAGEAAFEVLISEARELSDALGCRVLDSKRSTLSRQTTQHLRESVSNYVHRQKYFKKANAS